jgi:hypothetical protein
MIHPPTGTGRQYYPAIKASCIGTFYAGSVVALNGFDGSPSMSSFR